jgi:hypothetical protein
MTAGTNQPEPDRPALDGRARALRLGHHLDDLRQHGVAADLVGAHDQRSPVWFIVPPMTLAPTVLVTGIDSPVTIDSSIEERPSSTSPSTGTFSPGRTRNRSPTAIGVERDFLVAAVRQEMRRAVLGARSSRALIAPEVCSRARSSSTWPSSTSTVMTAAASK